MFLNFLHLFGGPKVVSESLPLYWLSPNKLLATHNISIVPLLATWKWISCRDLMECISHSLVAQRFALLHH